MNRIKTILLQYPLIMEANFSRFDIVVMKNKKKDGYWGTSVKRFMRETNIDTNQASKSCLEGTIYINMRDVPDEDMILRIIAEEACHLLDDVPGEKEKIYQYLKEKYIN